MTATTPATTPVLTSPAPPRGYSWRAWTILWAVTIALQVLLLANNAAADTFLWRSTRWLMGDQDAYSWGKYKAAHAAEAARAAEAGVPAPFYTRIDPPWTRTITGPDGQTALQARLYKRTEIFWRVMRDLGEPVMTGIVILLVWVYDHRKSKAALMVLAATTLTGLAGWLLRATAGRYRPINIDGDNLWLFTRGFTETRDLSWPSGHATLAFATAAALAYLSPKGRNLFLGIAFFCALARVIMQAHFYSDIILGGAIGWTLGWMCMRGLDRVWRAKPGSVTS
jgi:membrane-associated phospholipid phosphatase